MLLLHRLGELADRDPAYARVADTALDLFTQAGSTTLHHSPGCAPGQEGHRVAVLVGDLDRDRLCVSCARDGLNGPAEAAPELRAAEARLDAINQLDHLQTRVTSPDRVVRTQSMGLVLGHLLHLAHGDDPVWVPEARAAQAAAARRALTAGLAGGAGWPGRLRLYAVDERAPFTTTPFAQARPLLDLVVGGGWHHHADGLGLYAVPQGAGVDVRTVTRARRNPGHGPGPGGPVVVGDAEGVTRAQLGAFTALCDPDDLDGAAEVFAATRRLCPAEP